MMTTHVTHHCFFFLTTYLLFLGATAETSSCTGSGTTCPAVLEHGKAEGALSLLQLRAKLNQEEKNIDVVSSGEDLEGEEEEEQSNEDEDWMQDDEENVAQEALAKEDKKKNNQTKTRTGCRMMRKMWRRRLW